MILFFLCLFVIVLIILLIKNASIKIFITNLNIDTESKEILKNYEFKVQICAFNKIPIIGYKINEKKVKKIQKSKLIDKIANIKFEKIGESLQLNFIEDYKRINKINVIKIIIKNLKLQILKFNFYLKIGTENVHITSYLVPILSLMLSLILNYGSLNVKKAVVRNYYYKINPVYNKNLIKLSLNCIINVKIVHIINIIYNLLIRKRRSDKYERTSYRRSYGYSHE